MPPESIWVQFAIVAIVVLAIGVIWHEMKKFIDEQDAKRENERKVQREWQAEQNILSDERWQAFLKSMQNEWLAQSGISVDVQKQLIAKVNELLKEFRDHDQYMRDGIIAMRVRTDK